jgi:hypothetical protein
MAMTTLTTKTVRELATENPAATRVFETLGIDYCCGGHQSLEEACRNANLSIDQVLDSLEMAEQTARATQTARDWNQEPLSELIAQKSFACLPCWIKSARFMGKTIRKCCTSVRFLRSCPRNSPRI